MHLFNKVYQTSALCQTLPYALGSGATCGTVSDPPGAHRWVREQPQQAVVATVLEEGQWWHNKRQETLSGMLGKISRRRYASGGVAVICRRHWKARP